MADEQDRAEALDDEKFDDVEEQAPPVALLDNTADAEGADVEADIGETGDELEGILGERERDPAPDVDGAGVAPEEAAMHIERQ
jgi:hypothetical protein